MHKFVIGALRVKPFLIWYTATDHKRINVKKIAFNMLKDVKFTANVYPLNLISMLESKDSLSIFTPST